MYTSTYSYTYMYIYICITIKSTQNLMLSAHVAIVTYMHIAICITSKLLSMHVKHMHVHARIKATIKACT